MLHAYATLATDDDFPELDEFDEGPRERPAEEYRKPWAPKNRQQAMAMRSMLANYKLPRDVLNRHARSQAPRTKSLGFVAEEDSTYAFLAWVAARLGLEPSTLVRLIALGTARQWIEAGVVPGIATAIPDEFRAEEMT